MVSLTDLVGSFLLLSVLVLFWVYSVAGTLFCMAVDAQHLAIERAVIRSVADMVELELLNDCRRLRSDTWREVMPGGGLAG
jgi:hypothetical protein